MSSRMGLSSARARANASSPHSAWSPAHDALVDAERLSFSSELSVEALASLPDELRSTVSQIAADLYGG